MATKAKHSVNYELWKLGYLNDLTTREKLNRAKAGGLLTEADVIDILAAKAEQDAKKEKGE